MWIVSGINGYKKKKKKASALEVFVIHSELLLYMFDNTFFKEVLSLKNISQLVNFS